MRARVGVLAVVLLAACGMPERDNPLDPGSVSGSGIALEASLPGGQILAERVSSLSFEVTGTSADSHRVVLASGTMSLVGRLARATVRGVTAGTGRRFRVEAMDASGIRTFAAERVVDVAQSSPAGVHLDLARLTGELELSASLPPEVAVVEVVVEADADSLRQVLTSGQAGPQRLAGIPTGADVGVVVRLLDADRQVLLEQRLSADIRAELLARVSLGQDAGSLEVVAHFPPYTDIVPVDRFSDAAGRFFTRSNGPGLPEAGQAVDFDLWPFQLRGLGPNGEGITCYHFDARSAQPAPAYVVVDRRGNPVPGQLPIFDLLPGDPGHTDLWQIHQVRAPESTFVPNELTSLQQVQERGYEVVATTQVMNCVMVPDGSRCSLRFDPATPTGLQDGWYRGRIVRYFLFENPASTATLAFSGGRIGTPQMYAFLENDADLLDGFARDVGGATRNVVAVLPGRGDVADYSPLWLVRVLRLNAFSQVTNLATASLQTDENINPDFTDLTINAPVVRVD